MPWSSPVVRRPSFVGGHLTAIKPQYRGHRELAIVLPTTSPFRRKGASVLRESTQIAVEYFPVDQLRPDPGNPRSMSDADLETLTRSIREWGVVDPIIVQRGTLRVIGGHQRVIASRRAGVRSVPVILLDITDERARMLNLALNRISGDWDQQLLGRMLQDLSAEDSLDLSLTGFGDDEIQLLLRQLSASENRDRDELFDADLALDEAERRGARSKPGDVWILGPHRLLCGDATDGADSKKLMAGVKAAIAFTDPPYNVGLGDHGGHQRGRRRRRIANDDLSPEQWEVFCRSWAQQLCEHVAGALYVCMSSKEWPTVSRILAEAGARWSDTIIWTKDQFVLGRGDYQRQYEPIWYGSSGGGARVWQGGRDQSDVWEISRPTVSKLHPTMKPLALVERAIENSSRVGDVVLDLFLGSGTTLIAAERTGRSCFAVELDPRYVDVAVARWEAFSGQSAERVAAG